MLTCQTPLFTRRYHGTKPALPFIMQTVLNTVISLGSFATVAAVRAAGHSDAEILAADTAREVCLKVGNDPRRLHVSDCIVLGGKNYQFLTA